VPFAPLAPFAPFAGGGVFSALRPGLSRSSGAPRIATRPAIAAVSPHRYIVGAPFPETQMLLALFQIVDLLLTVVIYIIIAQAILSWLVAFNVINTHNDFVRAFLNALDRITAPIYRPIRRILPDFGGLDFSPMVVILIILMLQMLLAGAARDIVMAGY
jgi:YggT family protein